MSTSMQMWKSRPVDTVHLSFAELHSANTEKRRQSSEYVVSSRALRAIPDDDHHGLTIESRSGAKYTPTHWAFGQLCSRVGVPADYARTIPSEIAADCINYGLGYTRQLEDIGVMVRRNGATTINAVTGPKYGRIWDEEVSSALIHHVDGNRWHFPGLYASDRDMFCFAVDQNNPITVPGGNGRDTMLRGFFVWNSETGKSKFGMASFMLRSFCMNRTIFGMREFSEVSIRHTASAPDRMLEEALPALRSYAEGSAAPIVKLIEDARQKRIDDPVDFLTTRFSKRLAPVLIARHLEEEKRPVETIWDAVNAVTAHARTIEHQDARVEFERASGDILKLAS